MCALDPLTGEPATPLNPIGWADLTDESTDTQFKLGVLVADGTTTYADYVVSATTTASSLLADATAAMAGEGPDGQLEPHDVGHRSHPGSLNWLLDEEKLADYGTG